MDFLSDNNPVALYRAMGEYPVPEWVAQENIPTQDETTKLASVAFADPAAREFPIHTKIATFLSCAYAGLEGLRGPLQERLVTAARQWGIEDDVAQYFADTTKVAANPHCGYGLVLDTPEGQVGHFPCRDRDETTASLQEIDRTISSAKWSQLDAGQIKKACVELTRMAAHFKIDVPAKITDIATRLPDPDTAIKLASLRARLTDDEEIRNLYIEAAEAAKRQPARIDECMNVWLDLDRHLGVKYSSCFPSPWAAFHSGVTEQQLDQITSANVFIGDVPIPKTVIAAMPDTLVTTKFAAADQEVIQAARAAAIQTPTEASIKLSGLSRRSQQRLLVELANHA